MSDIINSTAFVACFGIACFMLFMLVAVCYGCKSETSNHGSYQLPAPQKPSGGWYTKTCYGPDFILLHRWEGSGGELAVRINEITGFFESEKDGTKYTVIEYCSGDYMPVEESFEEIKEILAASTGRWFKCKKEEED